MKPARNLLTVAEFAAIAGVSPATVHEWVQREGLPTAVLGGRGRGRRTMLDPKAAGAWYRAQRARPGGLEHEYARLAHERADLLALRRIELERELAGRPGVERYLEAILARIRRRARGIGAAVAPGLEGLSAPEIKAALDHEFRDLLEWVADGAPAGRRRRRRSP
jgi:hypothetical protein